MKILVVDDEKDIQMLFEQRFRKEIRKKEIEFVFAFSGDEALAFLNQKNQDIV
ncbi:MAG TPA: response regulator, partial [Bacteroidales bacterium]|nr:response regulator [Bacteroidales bacterium]